MSAVTGPNPTTLCALLFDRARSHATAPAVSTWTATGWETLSWGHYRTAIAEAAAGLAELGIARGDRVAIVAGNRAEHLVADQAIVHAGAVPVTLYSSLSADQLVYCVNDAGAVAVVLEDRAHLSRWWPLRDRMPSLRTIVLMDAFTDVAPAEGRKLDRLRDCVQALDEKSRELCRLRYEDDLKPAAIGERLGVGANAAAKALQRVRDRLRECVERKAARPEVTG